MADPAGGNPAELVKITIDAGGWFKAVSAPFLALVGQPVEALAGVNVADLVHPGDAVGARQLLALGTGAAPLRFFAADDTWRSLTATAATTDDDRIVLTLTELVAEPAPEPGPIEPVPIGSPVTADPFLPAADTAVTPPAASAPVRDPGSSPTSGSTTEFARAEAADRRAAIRDHVGDASTPMIEINPAGVTTFVQGIWDSLNDEGLTGNDALEKLLSSDATADAVGSAIAGAIERAETSTVLVEVLNVGRRWVHVVPMPSPHWGGVVHALLAVTDSAHLEPVDIEPVAAPVTPVRPPPASTWSEETADEPSPAVTPAHAEADGLPDGATTEVDPEPAAAEPEASNPLAHLETIDGVDPSTADAAATAVAPTELVAVAPASRATKIWIGVAGVATYLAMQGLYFGPAYDWPSPLQGLLDSNNCRVQSLCDNEVLRFNHLAVVALIVAVVACTALFRRMAPARLEAARSETARPHQAADLVPTSWKPSLAGPGLAAWLAIAAAVVISAQTLFGDGASVKIWVLASALGAIAAWRSDREADRPVGATMAALAVALACLLVPLGIGTVWLGNNRLLGVVVIIAGALLFRRATQLNRRSDSTFDVFDYTAMLGFSVLALVLGLLRHHSWRYAFIDDEWSFYDGALGGLRGKPGLGTFDIGGPNNYFTGLTFELQTSVMRIAGDDVWGWRLSALMPMVLSVASMYAFTRWLAGRTAAIAAAAALASSHMLLSFSMIGYNNSQSLVAVSASFAALAWAHQRPSALRFFLLGSAAGSTFLVYAMARLALLPLALLFIFLFRDNLAAFARRLGWAALGGISMAAPALFSGQNWEALLKATPVQAEDPVPASGGVGRQIVENTFTGWLSFIGSVRNSHFVIGPHLDVISAVLLIIGVGYAIARSRRDIAVRWFVVGGIGLWTAINAIQQYDTISNTRSFMIPLVYCVFIGLGARAIVPWILDRVGPRASRRTLLAGLGGLFVLTLVLVNQRHITNHSNNNQQLTEQAMLVQQFQSTESVDGQGMPVYIAWPDANNARLTIILRAHDIAPERFVIVPPEAPFATAALCAQNEPIMVVVHRSYPEAPELAARFAECWGTSVVEVFDPSDGFKLSRVANPAGEAEFDLDSGDRVRLGPATAPAIIAGAIDVEVDGDGVGYVLSREPGESPRIHRLAGGGSFAINQGSPVDFAITADGLFVVAGAGGDDRLVWYDGRGNAVHRYQGHTEMPVIGGITVAGDRLWVSDTGQSRLMSFDSSFVLDDLRFGEGALAEPASLAAGPDGAVWVYDARSAEILLVDAEDRVTTRIAAAPRSVTDAPRLSSTGQGWLINSRTERPVVELVAPNGEIVDARGGTSEPRAAASGGGQLIVADPRWNEVASVNIDEQWSAPADRGVVNWNGRSLRANTMAVYESAFAGLDQQPSGPAAQLLETEPIVVAEGQTWRSVGATIFTEAHAVGANADGVLVVDLGGRAVRLDTEGAAISGVSVAAGSSFISDLVIDESGTAWILDAGAGRLTLLNPDDTIRVLDTEAGLLNNARGLGLGRDGTVWIASTAGAQLLQIGDDGAVRDRIPLPARQPSDVVELDDGSFWIIDSQELSLVHLARDGVVLAELPLAPFTSNESPHLTIARDLLWVTDPDLARVFSIDLTTEIYTGDQVPLVRPDATEVRKPIGIASTPDGQLWLLDSQGGASISIDR